MKSTIAFVLLLTLALAGCDRVGSAVRCEKHKQKPKDQWTMEEAGH